jgi:hypothetical protein
LTDSELLGLTGAVNVGTGVSLSKSGSASVCLRVNTWRVSSIGFTTGEPGLRVVSWHDPFTAHFVESVLTHERGGVRRVFGGTDTETELGVGHVVHPFLVVDVRARDVGGDVAADRVSVSGSSVRVELTTLVTCYCETYFSISPTSNVARRRNSPVAMLSFVKSPQP